MSDEGLRGYLAGVLDADGNINKVEKTGRWYVNITNTAPELLDAFVQVFGGSVQKHRGAGETSSSGITSTKPIYRWWASGAVGMALCEASLPYLIVKKNKAAQAVREKFGLKIWPPRAIDRAAIARRKAVAEKKRAAVRERQRRALELHTGGMSYREIMRELGYQSSAGAYAAVQAGRSRCSKQAHGSGVNAALAMPDCEEETGSRLS
ncbi:MAG TPA: hypothetical protein VM537_35175 [Anaerolineae bacterium]|nr:hypothetical protein [Anaerolineae bacterium]